MKYVVTIRDKPLFPLVNATLTMASKGGAGGHGGCHVDVESVVLTVLTVTFWSKDNV